MAEASASQHTNYRNTKYEQETCTDTTSSEDEGCKQIKRRRVTSTKYIVKVDGENNNVAVGEKCKFNCLNSGQPTFDAAHVLEHLNEFIEQVTEYRGPEKNRIENFILQDLLPYIEKHAARTGNYCNDTLEVLARLSSPLLKSPRVAKHSLKMLKRLTLLEFGMCEAANAHVVATEKVLRQAFIDGSFKEELTHCQRRRVEVYSDVLVLILLCQANGHLTHPYTEKDKEEIEKAKSEIKKSLQKAHKKDRRRHAMETVLNLTDRLFQKKKSKQLIELLELSREMLEDELKESDVDGLLEKIHRAEDDSLVLHVIMKMLHGKVNNKSNAFGILQWIIKKQDVFDKQLWSHRNENWKFVLLACQILVDTIINHKTKGTRTEAAHLLASFQATRAFRKSVLIQAIVEKYFLKAAFAPDLESRKLLVEKRFRVVMTECKLPWGQMLKEICTSNRLSDLDVSETVCRKDDHVVFRGLYRCQPVAVKVCSIDPVSQLYTVQDQETLPSEKAFQKEVSVLRLLNKIPNTHVPRLYTADTTTLPHHMVSEYMPHGDLLQYLKDCRERKAPSYRQLLQICLETVEGIIFLHEHGVIYNGLRAEHILLGENLKCKITGFDRATTFTENTRKDSCHGDHICHEDSSIRWAAPECLREPPLYSAQSDVWAFGVLMYEVFTCGCVPYASQDLEQVFEDVLAGRTLPKEFLMRDDIFVLMQQCFAQQAIDRPSFGVIRNELKKLLSKCNEKDDSPILLASNIPTENEELATYDDLPIDNLACSVSPETTAHPALDSIVKLRFNIRKAKLVDGSKSHADKLKSLNHAHVVKVIAVHTAKRSRSISYEHYKGKNLRQHIQQNNCTAEDLVRFAAQIADGLNYLNSNGIVHCALRAENISVVNDNHVKISGLHYSRSLPPSPYNEENSSSSSVYGESPVSSHRWSDKEVIQEGLFSKESDMWSFSMMLWEMFACLDKQDESVKPFHQYGDDEILTALKMGERPFQPTGCPDWIYIIMTQCWLLHPCERASCFAVRDSLTHKVPWESYVLQLWKEKHEITENWPNLYVAQLHPDEYVVDSTRVQQDVKPFVSAEFVDKHSYEYQPPSWSITRKVKDFGKRVYSGFRKSSSSPSSSSPSSSSPSSSSAFWSSLPPPAPVSTMLPGSSTSLAGSIRSRISIATLISSSSLSSLPSSLSSSSSLLSSSSSSSLLTMSSTKSRTPTMLLPLPPVPTKELDYVSPYSCQDPMAHRSRCVDECNEDEELCSNSFQRSVSDAISTASTNKDYGSVLDIENATESYQMSCCYDTYCMSDGSEHANSSPDDDDIYDRASLLDEAMYLSHVQHSVEQNPGDLESNESEKIAELAYATTDVKQNDEEIASFGYASFYNTPRSLTSVDLDRYDDTLQRLSKDINTNNDESFQLLLLCTL